MKNNAIAIGVVTLIIGASAGFFGGMKYQQSQRPAGFNGGQLGNGQPMMRNGQGGNTRTTGNVRGGLRPVNGEIISADDKSITVKLQDGSSKIILISEKTQINKAQIVDQNELKSGSNVAVFGTENTDGSVTAQNIQLDPMMKIENAE